MFNKHFHTPKHHVLLSDSVRNPIGRRSVHDDISCAFHQQLLRFTLTVAALFTNSRYTLTQPKTPCCPVDNVDNTCKRLIYNKKLLTYYVYNGVERQGIVRLNDRNNL